MRYVLKGRLRGCKGGLDRLLALPDVQLIDRIGDQAMLIEASEINLGDLRRYVPNLLIAPETSVAAPTPPSPRPAWKVDLR